MKLHRPLFAPVVSSLFVAIMASAVWWGGTPASAATSTVVLVPVYGAVFGLPESVSFSGQAQLDAKVVADPDLGAPPTVVLSINLSQVSGVGSLTGKKYVTSSQEILNRRLTADDLIQISFPFFPSGGGISSARIGIAFFNLSFNVSTGKLTWAKAEVISP